MSFRGIAEFVLHIEHFRNVDLFQQGLYFMKFQIYNEDADKVRYTSSNKILAFIVYTLTSILYLFYRSIMRIRMTTFPRIMKPVTKAEQISIDYKNHRSMMKVLLL
jgi:hypothetical protein